jgi:hypothetical protein
VPFVRHRPADDRGEAPRRLDRRLGPRVHDGARHPARRPLFAEAINHVGQLGFLDVAQEIGDARAPALVHAHVERFITPEAEPPPFRVELHRRDTEVGQHAGRSLDAALAEHAIELAIVGVDQLNAIAESRQGFARDRQSVEIAIQPEHAVRSRLEQRAAVAAEADRTVDEHAAARGLELLQHFGDHHGLVRGRHRHRQIPNSARARASSSVYGSRCIFETKRSWFHTSRWSTRPKTSTSPAMPADSRSR